MYKFYYKMTTVRLSKILQQKFNSLSLEWDVLLTTVSNLKVLKTVVKDLSDICLFYLKKRERNKKEKQIAV